jgi:hypothetical protein
MQLSSPEHLRPAVNLTIIPAVIFFCKLTPSAHLPLSITPSQCIGSNNWIVFPFPWPSPSDSQTLWRPWSKSYCSLNKPTKQNATMWYTALARHQSLIERQMENIKSRQKLQEEDAHLTQRTCSQSWNTGQHRWSQRKKKEITMFEMIM